ncbi:MAG: cell surface protein SprA, partial [Calditrichaeota bacterium]
MNALRRHLLFFLLLSTLQLAHAVGLQQLKSPPDIVPVVPPVYHGLQHFFVDSTLFSSPFSGFRRVVKIDTAWQFVDIEEQLFNHFYRLPIRVDLDYFIRQNLAAVNREKFRETTLKYLQQAQQVGGGGIRLNIPMRIKSKAFRRIFGGDQVGLRVTGNISFELSGRQENRSGSALNSFDQGGIFTPRFKQTQQFRVEGKVGDKVTVSVDQNSEATFDFENTLRLVYEGDEDEIVQKIEAGNVALTLPQTRFVSVNSNHQGLFGLKSQMRVGNFKFTGIASLERGQNQKITKTGSATENTFRIRDYEYVRDRFFFVDSSYLDIFGNFNDRMVWQLPANRPIKILQLDVWISTRQSDPDKPRQAYATIHPNEFIQKLQNGEDPNEFPVVAGQSEAGFFKRLEFGKDYDYDEFRGYFWLNRQVNDQDVIAISYITEGDTVGMPFQKIDENTPLVILKLIKPRAAKPEFKSTWKLAMRNVYNLGASGISTEGFDVKILFYKTGEDLDVDPATGKTFNFLLGLDRLNEQGNLVDGGDRIIDVRNGWIFDLAHGYLIFPELTPFNPPPGSRFAFGDPSLKVDIYNLKDRTEEINRSKFELEITTKSVSSTFDLGFNVLEGSEVVRLNGRVLERDKDYTIDYFSGQLQILAPEARRADAQVEIDYERGSLFQLDKKTLLGGRLDYEFGENNFIGLTTLFFNQTTLDQRIRVGQEPIKNFIWDINSSFTFKPNFLTRALDKLPLVETSAESRLKLEAEIAQVKPNPNSFNEKRLGEKKGVAYIDDFEGSKRFTTLGIGFRTWSFASVPVRFRIPELGIDYSQPTDARAAEEYIRRMDRNRVQFNWFNPFTPVPIKDIWPDKDVNAQTGTTTNVLNLRWKNDSIPRDSAWAGIMRSTITFPDQKKTKFIELWVLGDVGRINIDIGKISEDYWVRGTVPESGVPSLGNLNTEDKNGNGLLDLDEDTGIDGIPDELEDGSYDDNWAAPANTNPPFLGINGTEGNSDAQGARFPDTEDLNENGIVDLTNEYFSYSFDLSDQTNPYIKGRTEKGWRLYRIPIREPDFVIGNPDTNFQEIFAVRLWINNLEPDSQYHFISLATFEFVGNEWEEQGVTLADSNQTVIPDSSFSIAVYNTEENVREVPGGPEAYHSPPNVTGIRDRITRALSKEQSLVLQLRYLPAGAVAEARKQLAEKMNILHYRKLKAFVHGDRNLPEQDSPLEFFIRFGPNSDIYYEVGEKVYPHWDERNNVEIDFDELTRTKRDEFLIGDTLGNLPVHYRKDPNNPEKYFKVVGNPGLHNINYFVIGARNVGPDDIRGMEIWVDELRVTDVERQTGTAMRVLADLALADVATFRGQWEMVDDDFRKLEQKFASTNGRDMNRHRQSYFAKVQLDKFLPESFALQIPVNGSITRSQDVPKYFYNSDQRTHYQPTGVDRLRAFLGMVDLSPELKAISTLNESRTLGATIQRRRSPKSPWYFRYTIDRLVLDLDYAKRHSSSANVLFNDGQSLSARLQYSLDF